MESTGKIPYAFLSFILPSPVWSVGKVRLQNFPSSMKFPLKHSSWLPKPGGISPITGQVKLALEFNGNLNLSLAPVQKY